MAHKDRGILLMNLGSPDDTSTKSVKRYLDEFLMDEKVIDKPYWLRLLLVRGIITPLRSPKSAEAYKEIWTKDGSPLVNTTKIVKEKLQQITGAPIAIAMRYGNPSSRDGFEDLLSQNPQINDVVAVPMYPHYAMSSFETAVDAVQKTYDEAGYNFKLRFVKPYYNKSSYINALATIVRPFVDGDYDHLLFSYHGIPERHIRKTDITNSHCLSSGECCSINSDAHRYCYRHHCMETTRLLAEALGLPKNKFSVSFQSRLGKGWLQPFTDKRLQEMPKEGIKKLLVICPAFVSDCLETLEEIAMRGKEDFMKAGGEAYTMIPCLNESKDWISTIEELVNDESMILIPRV